MHAYALSLSLTGTQHEMLCFSLLCTWMLRICASLRDVWHNASAAHLRACVLPVAYNPCAQFAPLVQAMQKKICHFCYFLSKVSRFLARRAGFIV